MASYPALASCFPSSARFFFLSPLHVRQSIAAFSISIFSRGPHASHVYCSRFGFPLPQAHIVDEEVDADLAQ